MFRLSLIALLFLLQPALLAAEPATRPADLGAQIAQFATTSSQLKPKAAAAQWLALYDRTTAALDAMQSRPPAERRQLVEWSGDLLASLPPPTAWRELKSQIDARPAPSEATGRVRDRALRLLGHLLLGDTRGREAVLQNLRDAVQTGGDRLAGVTASSDLGSIERLVGAIAEGRGLVFRFQREIEEFHDDPAETLKLPDLYRLGDGGTAEGLAKAAVVGAARIELSGAGYTDNRVLQLARQHVSSMAAPHFELVRDEASLDLFEEMDRRFTANADAKPTRRGRNAAWDTPARRLDRHQGLRLLLVKKIRDGATDEAAIVLTRLLADSASAAAAKEQGAASFEELFEETQWNEKSYATLIGLLRKNPSAPLWTVAWRAASQQKKADEWFAYARDALGGDALEDEPYADLRATLLQALLKASRQEEAIKLLQPDADNPLEPPPAMREALLLSELSAKKVPDREAALQSLQQSFALLSKQATETGDVGDLLDLAQAAPLAARGLVLQRKSAEAADLLVRTAGHCKAVPQASPKLLAAAVATLHDAGQHGKAVELLDAADGWGAADVAPIASLSLQDGRLLGVVAGTSLAKSGKQAQGMRAIEAALCEQPDAIEGYIALIDVAGKSPADLIPLLERLIEKRSASATPLIWKAEVLRLAGKLETAEKAATAALARRPTEELRFGDNHLLQGHRTMSAILHADGRGRDAIDHDRAVKAADLIAGLEDSAGTDPTAVYEQAAKLFPKWLELRARIMEAAIDRGDVEAARTHAMAVAERAIKLKLQHVTIGPALKSAMAHPIFRQELAKVAEEQLADEPGDATVHYLLGLSQLAARRPAEAAVAMSAATLHDPKFAAAWADLQQIAPTVEARSHAALQLLALGGGYARERFNPVDVVDLQQLWRTAAAVSEPTPITAAYPLAASAGQLQAKIAQPVNAKVLHSPGRALSQTQLMKKLRSLLFPQLPTEL